MFFYDFGVKMDYSYSKELFEEQGDFFEGTSIFRIKINQLCDFTKKLIKLPFCICSKLLRTAGRALRVLSTMISLFVTLGVNEDVRISFSRKVVIFAEDLADWLLYPFALSVNLIKSFLCLLIFWKI